MRTALSLCVLLLAACFTVRPLNEFVVLPQSVAETDPSIHWYDVEGATRADVRSRLDASGPFDSDGERHDAYTEWFVSWHFPFAHGVDGCRVGAVSSTLRVIVTLPRWRATEQSDPRLLEHWRDYVDALWVHENHGASFPASVL